MKNVRGKWPECIVPPTATLRKIPLSQTVVYMQTHMCIYVYTCMYLHLFPHTDAHVQQYIMCVCVCVCRVEFALYT